MFMPWVGFEPGNLEILRWKSNEMKLKRSKLFIDSSYCFQKHQSVNAWQLLHQHVRFRIAYKLDLQYPGAVKFELATLLTLRQKNTNIFSSIRQEFSTNQACIAIAVLFLFLVHELNFATRLLCNINQFTYGAIASLPPTFCALYTCFPFDLCPNQFKTLFEDLKLGPLICF